MQFRAFTVTSMPFCWEPVPVKSTLHSGCTPHPNMWQDRHCHRDSLPGPSGTPVTTLTQSDAFWVEVTRKVTRHELEKSILLLEMILKIAEIETWTLLDGLGLLKLCIKDGAISCLGFVTKPKQNYCCTSGTMPDVWKLSVLKFDFDLKLVWMGQKMKWCEIYFYFWSCCGISNSIIVMMVCSNNRFVIWSCVSSLDNELHKH